MLAKLLSPQTCARCRICCGFDDEDIWEIPIIDESLKARISELLPDCKYIKCGEDNVFEMNKDEHTQLYMCPALDEEKGCTLGECKPFDCKIWPFRVMRFEGRNVLTLSPVCPHVFDNSMKDIMEVAHKLEKQIFDYASKTPSAVKPYIQGYPIVAVEE